MLRVFTTGELRGESLRAQQERIAVNAMLPHEPSGREQRRRRRARRRDELTDRIGRLALAGREEPTWVAGGTTYLAEDDHGYVCAPRARRSDWYVGFEPWRPLHAVAWLRTLATGRMVMVERG